MLLKYTLPLRPTEWTRYAGQNNLEQKIWIITYDYFIKGSICMMDTILNFIFQDSNSLLVPCFSSSGRLKILNYIDRYNWLLISWVSHWAPVLYLLYLTRSYQLSNTATNGMSCIGTWRRRIYYWTPIWISRLLISALVISSLRAHRLVRGAEVPRTPHRNFSKVASTTGPRPIYG